MPTSGENSVISSAVAPTGLPIEPEPLPTDVPHGNTNGYTNEDRGEGQSPLTGTKALLKILECEKWEKFGFVLIRTFYKNEALWLQFLEKYEPLLHQEIIAADLPFDAHELLNKVEMDIVSDDCMDNKIPEHVAMAYRMFSDVEPGLKTKMCLMVDQECMEYHIFRH
ncbi:hypothetical protein BJY04DRAFT_142942 [Aspergillus karnatakaensis]|uniref:uncharacterized protein n=1 Tax=Aspergillus karnatakaensis TaxID=1810916 RepID=UPI003CCD3ACF